MNLVGVLWCWCHHCVASLDKTLNSEPHSFSSLPSCINGHSLSDKMLRVNLIDNHLFCMK